MKPILAIKKTLYNLRHRAVPRVKAGSDKGFSSHGQDEFVADTLLPDVKQGVFVEIGGNDGIFLSNTYYFEKHLGWSGVAIEPLPKAYAKLEQNRNCATVNGCVADYDGETSFLEITGTCEMLSGIPDKYDKRHVRRVRKNLKRHGATSREITVPCFTLGTILKEQGFDHVDYLSIDTEGGELDILKSIPFDRIDVSVVSVENNYYVRDIEDFMASKGYRLVALAGCDEIYSRR
jgi:FkbM family methyltransferase